MLGKTPREDKHFLQEEEGVRVELQCEPKCAIDDKANM